MTKKRLNVEARIIKKSYLELLPGNTEEKLFWIILITKTTHCTVKMLPLARLHKPTERLCMFIPEQLWSAIGMPLMTLWQAVSTLFVMRLKPIQILPY